MNWNKIYALSLRHIYLIKGSFPRILDLIYWPTIQIFLWGDALLWKLFQRLERQDVLNPINKIEDFFLVEKCLTTQKSLKTR